jgi:hypothetical protein
MRPEPEPRTEHMGSRRGASTIKNGTKLRLGMEI